ncbi:carboxypeptidase-like regulatory domain-containing protein [uncultured Aquimarina sp.]|uniref:carboxypeptidase-like regulatory domain-containing protein n=1 Tax=uncultured Aquimarina sp. TaxID=575652 RepID=UPI00261F6FAD|nr:carboxypeptidase-like regulatory domain-containing protein [uncultured Aquimarina sp.]
MIPTRTSLYVKKKSSIVLLLLVCSILFLVPANAQNEQKNNQKPLLEVLEKLETQFSYQFTYADDTIKDIFVNDTPENLSLEEILASLQQQTRLTFTVINDNFIVINKRTESLFVCGYIKDYMTKEPLVGATVRTEKLGVVTEQNGFFRLEVGSEEEVVIEHLGFQTINKVFNLEKNEECATVFLIPKTETLGEITIKNYLVKGIDKTDQGVFRIDYDKFGILPGLIETDVLQTIQALPGIQSTDETVSNINIRGGTNDQNLILWDGIKMYQSGHFFGMISIFNPSITNNATVIKNGSAATLQDGVSGTILINTDDTINKEFKTTIGLNLINADIFTDIPIGKKSSLQLSARKALNDFIETPTYEKYFERISQDSEIGRVNETDIGFDFYDVNLRWNWQISKKDKIRLNFLGISNELVFTENDVLNEVDISRQSSLIQNSFAGGLWYQRNWNPNFDTTLQVYETDYQLEAVNVNIPNQQRFLQENIVSETGAKIIANYRFRNNIKWQNGYQFIETGVSNLNDVDDPIFRRNQIRVIRNHSVFSQAEYQGSELKNSLMLGVRYTYNEKFKKHFIEPRISYNQRFFDYFNLEILGEFKHQNTSQIINFQNDFLGIEKRRWILSNDDDIPVVTSKQASLGVSYNQKGWLVSSEAYYKLVEGITARSQGFQNQYEFTQATGDYTVTGLDILVNKRFHNLSSWLGYSFVDNNYTFPDFQENKFPNNIDITHSITFGVAYTYKDLKISSGLNWHSGLPTTIPVLANEIVDDEINYNPANSDRLPAYMRFDISATYDFKLSQKVDCHAGISVWNFSDINNTISSYYTINEGNVQEVMNSALGITPNATFRASF